MNAYNEGPNDYGFGLEFNYSLWTENTTVSLVNVPWNNDYRDIVGFADQAALDRYIDSQEPYGVVLTNLSYVKPNEPVRIPTPFNVATRYNYLRASNPLQPIVGDRARSYYYFITNVQYINPGLTNVTLQLDVWQTFGYDAEFGNCYIEQGHIGIANQHAFENNGRNYLTVPEGIDAGSEYVIVDTKTKHLMGNGTSSPSNAVWNILVVSTIDLQNNALWGDESNPKTPVAPSHEVGGLLSGSAQYLWENAAVFEQWVQGMKDKSWITQGIQSITLIPPIDNYFPNWNWVSDGPVLFPGSSAGSRQHKLLPNWRAVLQNNLPKRYRHLLKFLTSPYCMLELTTFSGTPLVLKPESWSDLDATVAEYAHLVLPGQRIAIVPLNYNAADASYMPRLSDYVTDGGESFDLATYIQNFPTMTILNNGQIQYLASQAHSIAYSRQAADWSQQRALQGNTTSYDQATRGVAANTMQSSNAQGSMYAQTAIDQTARASMVGINALSSAAGVAMGGAVGGVGAAVGGISQILGSAVAANAQSQSTDNSAATLQRSTNIQNSTANYMRDTNKSLADWSARGDYQNAIAGINAKVQDAQSIPPTTAGQVGGDAFNLAMDMVQIALRFKFVDPAAMRRIGDYWLRYGYAVREFARPPKTLQVMTKFTYWKMQETYLITTFMPEAMKQILRGIFEKGVTVWADPSFIGTTDISDNTPLAGIALT